MKMTMKSFVSIFVIASLFLASEGKLPLIPKLPHLLEYPVDVFKQDFSSDQPMPSEGCLRALFELEYTHSNNTDLMLLYSGTGIQALGMYEDCQELDFAHYCMMTIMDQGIPLRTGLCVPRECSETDIPLAIALNFINITVAEGWMNATYATETVEYYLSMAQFNCANKGFEKPNGGAIFVFFFLSLLTFFCFIGGVLEYSRDLKKQKIASGSAGTPEPSTSEKKALLSNQGSIKSINDIPKDGSKVEGQPLPPPRRQPLYISFFLAFSPIENFKRLLVPAPVQNLASLNGLRTLSMCWVILGHTVYWASFTEGYENADHIREVEVGTFTAQFMVNATFSVDAFFYMSGFLVAYLCHTELKKKGKINLGMYYFHRVWRLSPPYYVALLILWLCLPYFGNGPFWFQVDTYSSRTVCYKYFWTNFLYINNFVPTNYDDTCMGWSWYLANDMQMYILTPIFIFAFWKKKILGWIVLAVSMIASLITNFVLVHKNGYSDYLPELEFDDGYDTYVYSKFYTRATAWLVGIAAAWILVWHEERKVKTMSPIVQVVLWILSGFFMGSTVFGTMGQYHTTCMEKDTKYCDWNRTEVELYLTFSRTIFSIGVAIMMHLCYIGKGFFIDSILSFRLWDIMARLTFSAYLYHPILMSIMYFNSVSFFHYSVTEVAKHFISFTVMAFVAAIISYLLIEKPMMNLEKLLHPPPRQK